VITVALMVLVSAVLPTTGAATHARESSAPQGQVRKESRDSNLVARCRRATAELSAARTPADSDRATDLLRGCDVSGPEALARSWQAPPADRRRLQRLAAATKSVPSPATLSATLQAASDRRNNDQVRLAALSVLASFAVPAATVPLQVLESPSIGSSLPRAFDAEPQPTTRLSAADVRRIRDEIARLSTEEGSAKVRAAAMYLVKAFELELGR
jgi:hypothetical protein